MRICAYDFHFSIQKRRGKLGRNVSFNESHALYRVLVNFVCGCLKNKPRIDANFSNLSNVCRLEDRSVDVFLKNPRFYYLYIHLWQECGQAAAERLGFT